MTILVLVPVLSILAGAIRLRSSNDISTSLGVYMGVGNLQSVSKIEAKLGGPIESVMTFSDGSSWASIIQGASAQCEFAQRAHVRAVAPYNMLPNDGGSLAQGARGLYNTQAHAFAQRLIASGCTNAIVRIGWEFNGNWFRWSAQGQVASFIAYWRRIVISMRSVPGQHFSFLWNPTVAHTNAVPLAALYPGNSYVDVIGLDVYDTSIGIYPGERRNWQFILNATYGLDWLARFGATQHKMIAIPEWGLGSGSSGGGDDAYFVTKMVQWITSHAVLFATVWDYGSSPLLSSAEPKATDALIAASAR